MPQTHSLKALGLYAFVLALAFPAPAFAQEKLQSEVKRLENRVNEQQRQLDVQAEEIRRQRSFIQSYEKANAPRRATPVAVPHGKTEGELGVNPPVTLRPIERERPQIEEIANVGGVLSPEGMLTYENTMEYTNTTRNVFAFNGVQLAQVVLVGGITASAARRQIVQETGRLRLGITDRLEADVHAPFVYRNDNLSNSTATGATSVTTIEGYGLGDIDTGLAWQVNDGTAGWPYFVLNARYKANNADGPFDVPYDANNIATRLPTGTGFQTVEGSVTIIKVSDPAVLFANFGYVYDIARDIDRDFNGVHVGRVLPGDAINALAGFGFAINQDISFSMGYKHSYVFPTIQETTQGGVRIDTSSGSFQVGYMTFGFTYAVDPMWSVNFNVEAGMTNDAPDVHLILRIPIKLGKIF